MVTLRTPHRSAPRSPARVGSQRGDLVLTPGTLRRQGIERSAGEALCFPSLGDLLLEPCRRLAERGKARSHRRHLRRRSRTSLPRRTQRLCRVVGVGTGARPGSLRLQPGCRCRRYVSLSSALLVFCLGARFGQCSQPIARLQSAGGGRRCLGSNCVAIPTPHRAVLAHQTLARAERRLQAGTVYFRHHPDLREARRQRFRAAHGVRQRHDARRQQRRRVAALRQRAPVHRRVFVRAGLKIIAERSAHGGLESRA